MRDSKSLPLLFPCLIACGAAFMAPATAAATVWGVPGTGSNVCTVANPNCNTIAQANTAATSGDTIQIGAGAFPVPSQINLTKSLIIVGAGVGTTVVQPTAAAFSVRTNDIVLQDFTIQNGTVGVAFQSAASNNTQITRVAFTGQSSRGIDVSLAATFPVTNVAITDCQFAVAAIAIRTSSTAQVAGMTISGTSFTGGTYGLYVANDNSTSRFSGLTVQNTTFTNVGGGGNTYAVYAEEMRDVVIEDSTFTGGRNGVGLLKFYGSSGVAASNITIRRNGFTGFTGNALDLEVYLGGSTPGIGLENPITVEDNTIQKDVSVSLSSPAIFVRLPAQLTNAAVNIMDNDIALAGTFVSATQAHGIQLRGNGPVVVTGNTLDGGNVGGTGTTPPSSGIYVQAQTGSTSLPSGTFSNVMPATVSITASCNRIQGFRNGVSIWDSLALAYGGLQVGASVTLTENAILGNDAGIVTAAAPPTIGAENNYWGCPAGPTDPACDSVTGDVDATPFLSVIPACVACVANAECDDDLFCTGAETCSAGTCVAGPGDPCLGGPACGNLCNEATDDCFVPGGTVCRPVAGDCDVQEVCTGLGGACPADAVEPNTTTCRSSAGACDPAETCDGVGATCPADVLAPNGTLCRAAGGVCDVAETCDGVAVDCPADAKGSGVCRAAAGVCDVAETCDGVANDCPADAFEPASTVCRASAGVCDVAETCTGTGATCPADTGLPDTDADTVCDAIDNCVLTPNPGQENGDSDALGDVCDPCTNIVPTAAEKQKLTITKLLAPPNDEKLTLKGFLTSVPNSPTIDPLTNGLRVLLTDSLGVTSVDVTIPGGAYDAGTKTGWRANGAGTSWRYKGPGTGTNGLQKAQLKAIPSTPGKYKFNVKGKNGNYPVNTSALPLVGTIVIQTPVAISGQCGEATFPAVPPAKPSCVSASGGKTVKCK